MKPTLRSSRRQNRDAEIPTDCQGSAPESLGEVPNTPCRSEKSLAMVSNATYRPDDKRFTLLYMSCGSWEILAVEHCTQCGANEARKRGVGIRPGASKRRFDVATTTNIAVASYFPAMAAT